MYSFYVTVHALPAGATAGDEIEIAGRKVRPMPITPESLSTTALACSFEEARDRLGGLERMYSEADGSFVWTSPQGERAWQIDGNLYDRNGRLLFVDVKGTCPADQFDRLLQALGWPQTKLMFQLTREAAFLDEAEFRRFAAVD
ncbi:MAG: hypothetical protein WD063_18705 [Pirellulales bacterium]